MSIIQRIPIPGELSNEGYKFINGTPVPMPDPHSLHTVEVRRVTAETGGSYLDYITGRLAGQRELADSALASPALESAPLSAEMISCYRGYLRAVLRAEPLVNMHAPDPNEWSDRLTAERYVIDAGLRGIEVNTLETFGSIVEGPLVEGYAQILEEYEDKATAPAVGSLVAPAMIELG